MRQRFRYERKKILLQWEKGKQHLYFLRFSRVAPQRRKWSLVQRSCGLPFYLQALIADKVFGVAASLYCTGKIRQTAKSFQRKRLSRPDLRRNEDLVRVLLFLVNHQGFIRDVWGKGLCCQETKWLWANFPLTKTKKDFWAEWGPIFVAQQSRFCPLCQKSEVKGLTLRGTVDCW